MLADNIAGVSIAQWSFGEAEAARWVAMGEYYTNLQKSAANPASQRGREADAARWIAMGKYYTDLQAAEVARQAHHDLIVAARYTGLALEDYERTGKKSSLPACVAAEIAAELPTNIGSNGWKGLVPICSK